MKKFKLSTNDVLGLISEERKPLPKYCSQIINLANQNAQGTRPKVVGQMSDLIQEHGRGSLGEWQEWYETNNGDKINDATELISKMIDNLKEAIEKVDKDMVRGWVKDLVIDKTYAGLNFQQAIIAKIAQKRDAECRLATPEEESHGIDGFIGDIAVSVKASTYKAKDQLNEKIDAQMIYYTKKDSQIFVEYDF